MKNPSSAFSNSRYFFIWGLGLLGTSIALDLKKMGFTVAGVTAQKSEIETLHQLGIQKVFLADDNSQDLHKTLLASEGVIIATPAKTVLEILKNLKQRQLPQEIWFTDVSSAKKELMQELIEQEDDFLNFVGSHPMAGSDLSGPQNAYTEMFRQTTVFLLPLYNQEKVETSSSSLSEEQKKIYKQSLEKVTLFWQMLGGHPYNISYQQHDQWVAYLSHGLHLVSCMIPILMKDIPDIFDVPHGPAGGSFRDISRVSGSNPQLWKSIIEANRQEVVHYLKRLSDLSLEWHNALKNKNFAIDKVFEEANQIRKKLVPLLPPEPEFIQQKIAAMEDEKRDSK